MQATIPDPTRILSVSEFNTIIDDYLGAFGDIAIEGEISGYRVSQGRWVFFDIKDESCTVSCFAILSRIPFELKEGDQIILTGTPGLYTKSGRFSIRVKEIYPQGEGALQKAYEELKEKLETEGLFKDEYKQALPRFPKNIGIITSQDAAALTDVIRVINNRWKGITLTHIDARVQGPGSEKTLVAAIEKANKCSTCDVLILTRGGGSLADLQAFNHESVARAVFASRIPLISAIGHERDTVLTDFVADIRASTPSNAAEIVVQDSKEFLLLLSSHIRQIIYQLEAEITYRKERTNSLPGLLDQIIQTEKEKLTFLSSTLKNWLESSQKDLAHKHIELSHGRKQIIQLLEQLFQKTRHRLELTTKTLNQFDIPKTLERGFCLITKNDTLIKDGKSLSKGDQIDLQFSNTKKNATIT